MKPLQPIQSPQNAIRPKISVIIPIWNLWDLTKNCLNSLVEHTPQALLDLMEIIVVDNHSTDETAKALAPTVKRLFGAQGHALRMPHNLGFAKGCNIGAAHAQGNLLFFLNNDTQVTKGWLPPLLQALENNAKIGMVGPLLLYPSQKVQHIGITFTHTLELHHLYHLFPHGHPLVHKKRSLQAITGAALMLSAQLFTACGGFYEEYINGFEDLDLCCAVREKGLHLTCIPQSIIYHHTSQSQGRFDHDSQNAQLLTKRRQGIFKPDVHTIALEDGLMPILSPSLELYIALPRAKEEALTTAFTQHFSEERCLIRLENEPLWMGGHKLLAQFYSTQHMPEEALHHHLQLAQIAPLPEHIKAVVHAAKMAQDMPLATQTLIGLQDMLKEIANITSLIHKAQTLQAWAIQTADTALANIFATWLKEHKQ